MIVPDFEHRGYRLVTFSGTDFREAMIRFLNWLEQPNAKIIHANSGDYHNSNDFYVLHDTLHVEYENEFGTWHVQVICGDDE